MEDIKQNTIEALLREAKEKGASDLHITVGVPPKYRVNGTLLEMDYKIFSLDETEQMVLKILPEKLKAILQKKGEVDFAYSIANLGRYRVNLFKQKGAYAAVFRLIGTRIPSMEELGMPKSVVEFTKKKSGLILVTGPTGSGKSTSLASFIDIINKNFSKHIITLEEPIEYIHNHEKAIVNQREIGIDSISYSNALRAALREDPDVILVGEMRDLDTIEAAITAAEAGHLVFSTFYTIGGAATIDRIIDAFPTNQQQKIRIQLASVLELVVSQQLIPTIEENGRVAACEVMHATRAIKNLIRESKTHQITSIIQTSHKTGMQLMDDAIYNLYLNRKIDAEQAMEYAQDAVALERKL